MLVCSIVELSWICPIDSPDFEAFVMPDAPSKSSSSSRMQVVLVLGFTLVAFVTVGFAVFPTIKQQLAARPAAPLIVERKPILKGDPEAGEKLFFSERLGCAQCHHMGPRGGQLAPDLTQVGARYDDETIRRLILLPSQRLVAPGFVTATIVQTDGQIHTGITRSADQATIELFLTNGEVLEIPQGEVDELKKQPVSPMPQNYADLLTVRQLSDLVAFLLRGPSDSGKS